MTHCVSQDYCLPYAAVISLHLSASSCSSNSWQAHLFCQFSVTPFLSSPMEKQGYWKIWLATQPCTFLTPTSYVQRIIHLALASTIKNTYLPPSLFFFPFYHPSHAASAALDNCCHLPHSNLMFCCHDNRTAWEGWRVAKNDMWHLSLRWFSHSLSTVVPSTWQWKESWLGRDLYETLNTFITSLLFSPKSTGFDFD